jgi:hypothetical protein
VYRKQEEQTKLNYRDANITATSKLTTFAFLVSRVLLQLRYTLTLAQMGVDAHVPSSARKALVFSVGDVFVGHRVDIFFRQTEIWSQNKTQPKQNRWLKINLLAII